MAILASLLFFPVLLLFLFGYNIRAQRNNPPSPFKLPIIGNLHQLGSLPHRSLQDFSKKYGPLMLLHLGSTPALVVSTAEMAREVLKTNDLAFSSRPFSNVANKLLYNSTDIALTAYGEYWRQVRKICVTELLSVKRVQSFALVREEEIESMIKEIKASSSISAVDIPKMFLTLASNVVTRVALGKKYMEPDNNGRNVIADLARDLPLLLGAFSVRDYFPLFGWLDVVSGLEAKLNRNFQGLDRFFDQVIEDHRLCKTGDVNDEHRDFVDILLQVQKDSTTGFHISNDNIKAIMADMYAGATATTGTTLEWAMAEIIKNPNVMVKAQAEVRSVVGRKMKVEEKDLLQMDYLKYIIKETFRLHPPAPLSVPRESISSVMLQGYVIPPKTTVMINVSAIGRDPKSWENANEFLPERFANNPIDYKGNDFELIPFGAGRRICPGISFSSHIVELALANILYLFDWEFPGGANKDIDMSEIAGISVHKKIPLHLIPTYHFS